MSAGLVSTLATDDIVDIVDIADIADITDITDITDSKANAGVPVDIANTVDRDGLRQHESETRLKPAFKLQAFRVPKAEDWWGTYLRHNSEAGHDGDDTAT